jgi:hypothetical protein
MNATAKRVAMKPSLCVSCGVVEVFEHPGPARPLTMTEDEACRALLAHADLLEACKSVLHRKPILGPDTGRVIGHSYVHLPAKLKEQIEAAIAKAQG